jgi:hypothetical protein
MTVETYRKRPVTVETMLWDGTRERLAELERWAGNLRDDPTASPRFIVDADMNGAIYNDQEHCWINCPIGHRVVKGSLGEFHPVSPEAVAKTYERVDNHG